MEFPASDRSAPVLRRDVAQRVFSLDLEVGYEHLVFVRPVRQERRWLRRQNGLSRHGKDAQVELGIDQPAGLVRGHIDTQLLEQSEDRTGLDRPRCIVIAGDQDNRSVREGLAESLKLPEGEDDGVVAGTDGMKEIARDHYHIRSRSDHAVNCRAKGLGNVGFPLI
jgi:hypothetical protein